jgi:hypothetical protein
MVYWVQKGLSPDAIAEKIGMCAATISRASNMPYFKERLAAAQTAYEKRRSQRLADLQITDKTQSKLERAAQMAATIMIKALRGDSDITRQQVFVAKDLLDRTGYKAKEKIELETHNHNYSPQEVASAQTTLLEMQEILDTLGVTGTHYAISQAGDTYSSNPQVEDSVDVNEQLPS